VTRDVLARVEASPERIDTATGALAAVAAASEPVRAFLERNARPEEVALFVELSTRNGAPAAEAGSFTVLVPAFVTTELREAFVVGFLVFLPFLVVDLVAANILMSMGMVMVSPASISLPFKILLFVLVDGWPLLMKGLALGYR
jgi:flagellar biosynthesis protein FliP